MKVVILHHESGDSVAIIGENTNLTGIKYTEVDGEDSQKIISSNPVFQQELRTMFHDVLAAFGIHAAPPVQDLSINLSDSVDVSEKLNDA